MFLKKIKNYWCKATTLFKCCAYKDNIVLIDYN